MEADSLIEVRQESGTLRLRRNVSISVFESFHQSSLSISDSYTSPFLT